MMILVHKIELRPTAKQDEYLRRCCGTMRFVYNQLVVKFKAGEKYNRKEFQKYCSTLRQLTPWMQMVASRATYEAADDFHKAISNFFRTCKNKSGLKWKPPKFKKKGNKESCRFSSNKHFSVNERLFRVQGLDSLIKMREKIRFEGKVKQVTIKYYCRKWYASFIIETENKPKSILIREPSVGVDFGLKHLAVLSNGEIVENPKPLQKSLKKLKQFQKSVSRKYVKGAKKQSNRYSKAVHRVSRLCKKVADQRSAAQHKFTSDLVKRFSRIVIEDLNVNGMLRSKRFSRAVSDASFGSLRYQLEYKSKMAGVELVIADRFFPSSKTCSCCGFKVEKLSLKDRVFNCPDCDLSLDRDLNAAVNLNQYNSTSLPIRERSKTIALGLCKTTQVAEPFDGDNINFSFNERGISAVVTL